MLDKKLAEKEKLLEGIRKLNLKIKILSNIMSGIRLRKMAAVKRYEKLDREIFTITKGIKKVGKKKAKAKRIEEMSQEEREVLLKQLQAIQAKRKR